MRAPLRSASLAVAAILGTLVGCGSREPEDAPALAVPTGIPVAAPGATGVGYPARAVAAPRPVPRRPGAMPLPTPPPDPFAPGLDDEDEDGGAPTPAVPPKKKGVHL